MNISVQNILRSSGRLVRYRFLGQKFLSSRPDSPKNRPSWLHLLWMRGGMNGAKIARYLEIYVLSSVGRVCSDCCWFTVKRFIGDCLQFTAFNMKHRQLYEEDNQVWDILTSTLRRILNSWVVLTNNGQIICCWHPEEAPPYEHTRGDSVLKLQYRRDAKYRFQPDGPTNEELAKMTYTTKHRWFPNNEKKYVDPNPPVDREGI
ncbi:39S ribosomal protein L42 like protein [Argiope bruennichi]|uniref:Large ribosomal subunit protein mL42 n=1 Tax=Argiope bruennichi TaxID=94029 RepID=A0A8T0EJ88_ARGBR|nr:39S ribosomal protein L42 like protein [Argiope bruennichi]